MPEAALNFVTAEDCFVDFGELTDCHTKYGGDIKIQPASEVPEACDRCWQSLEPMIQFEKSKISPSASIDDLFSNLTPNYRPQMVHYHLHDNGSASVAWRIPFVSDRPLLKSLMVALIMRNGVVDPTHNWQMLGRGVGLNSLDIFLWGFLMDAEKECIERGEYPESLRFLGPPPVGFE